MKRILILMFFYILFSGQAYSFSVVVSTNHIKISQTAAVALDVSPGSPGDYTYEWSAVYGSVTGTGVNVTYNAPGFKCTDTISVNIKNGSVTVSTQSARILVYKQFLIIKADDVEAGDWWPGGVVLSTNGFMHYMRYTAKEKLGVGLMNIKSLRTANASYLAGLKEYADSGYVEYWIHSYDQHLAFNGESASTQLFWLSSSCIVTQDCIGVDMRVFGAPFNTSDSSTVWAMNQLPQLKYWLFGPETGYNGVSFPQYQFHCRSECAWNGTIWYGRATTPNYEGWLYYYNLFSGQKLIITQIHPYAYYIRDGIDYFAIWEQIIAHIKSEGLTTILPYEYYRMINEHSYIPPDPELPVPDTTPPLAPASVRDGTGTDVSKTGSLTSLSANWDAATDEESGISGYKYAIGTTAGGTNVSGWTTISNVLTVTKTGLTLSAGTTYYFSVIAINNASPSHLESSATNSDGQYGTDKQAMAYWKFDEGTGSSVADYSGNGNTGTLSGNPTWTTGKVSGGISLDGNDDIVTGSYTPPENNFTMCAWVIATTTHEIDTESSSGWTGISGQKYLFWPCQSGANAGAGVSVGTNGISVYEHGAAYMPPLAVYSGTLGTGWNHIVVVYENKQPKIYLNGSLVKTGLTSTKSEVYVSTTIGGGAYGMFYGTVDEVRIYPAALTSQEIQSLYNSYSTDTTSPTAPSSVKDGLSATADSSYTFSKTVLSANWEVASDTESSISRYEYAIGTAPGATNITSGWLTNGTNLTVTRTGLILTVGATYYFSVKAVNVVGLESSATNSDGQYVVQIDTSDDTTPPANITEIRDGTGVDISSTALITQLDANWDSATDAESDISRYWYAVGSSQGGTNIVNWTDNGLNTSVTRTGLTLTIGTTYYFSVKAENGVGLQGSTTTSNGQYVIVTSTITPPPPKPAEGINAFPNPCDFREGGVTFEVSGNAGGEVRIYTITGKLVRKVTGESGAGEVKWDGRNEDGEKVTRGVYIYKIGDSAAGKLAVK